MSGERVLQGFGGEGRLAPEEDRLLHGSGSRAYREVFTACPHPESASLSEVSDRTSLTSHGYKQSGFSLIEVITVVVILGIIAVIGTQFIVNATESYRSTQTRALLGNTGRQAVERMTRQLRGALPYSVRTTNGGNCVQFMPIAAAGFYLQPVSITTPSSNINTSPFNVEYFTAQHLVIGALSDTEIYGDVVRASLAPPISDNSIRTAVNFSSHTWERNSASQRFYLVSNPQAFCLNGSQLQFYENLSPSGGDVGLANPPDELLARNAGTTGAPLFAVNNATAENNIIVNINIGFSEGGETVDFFQEVSLRNVP